MRRQLVSLCAAAVGASVLVVSVYTVVISQRVTVVVPPPVVQEPAPLPAPVADQAAMPARLHELLEPMDTHGPAPAGRLLSMPRTGKE